MIGTYGELQDIRSTIDLFGYDCIIARGHTAQMLQQSLLVPVIEIKVTVYDFLRTVTAARQRGVPFAIVSSRNFLGAARQVVDILQYPDVIIRGIESEEEAREQIELLSREEGIRLIIGDVYAVHAAQWLNLSSILITSTRLSIEQAFLDAAVFYSTLEKNHSRQELILDVLQNGPPSVVLDSQGEIVLSNLHGIELPFIQLHKAIMRSFGKMQEGSQSGYCAVQYENYLIEVRGHLFESDQPYYVLYISQQLIPQLNLKQAIKVNVPSEAMNFEMRSKLYELPRHFLETDAVSLSSRVPTVIVGDHYTGKLLLSQYLWLTSPFCDYPMVSLECSLLDVSTLTRILNDHTSPLYNSELVLLIKNLDRLSLDSQRLLCEFLEATSFSVYHPLIVTSDVDLNLLLREQRITFPLFDYLVGNHYYVENLNERTSELPALAEALVSKYSEEYGKEIVGLAPDAVAVLQSFHWDSNINQIKSLIRQLVISTDADQHYIQAEEVRALLRVNDTATVTLSTDKLSGTLREIEQRIILRVLNEEGMNYSATAKRLNISRATLYRKLEGFQPDYLSDPV